MRPVTLLVVPAVTALAATLRQLKLLSNPARREPAWPVRVLTEAYAAALRQSPALRTLPNVPAAPERTAPAYNHVSARAAFTTGPSRANTSSAA